MLANTICVSRFRAVASALMIMLVLVSTLPFGSAMSSSVNSNPPQFTTGSKWSLTGSYRLELLDTQGSNHYLETGNRVWKFTVTNVTSTELHVNRAYENVWSCSATTGWTDICDKSGEQQTASNDHNYTISLLDMRVTATSASGQWIGHYPQFLLPMGELNDGGTVKWGWWAPNPDHKHETLTDVDWQISTQIINVNSGRVTAWKVSHTGDRLGAFFDKDKVYSNGPETDTYLFDPVYGTIIGASFTQTALSAKGGWTEAYTSQWNLENTSLQIVQPTTDLGFALILLPHSNFWVTRIARPV